MYFEGVTNIADRYDVGHEKRRRVVELTVRGMWSRQQVGNCRAVTGSWCTAMDEEFTFRYF